VSWTWLRMSLVGCFVVAGCAPPEQELGDATEHFLAAQDALAAGDSAQALVELTASIETQPDAWAYFQRARLLGKMEEDDRALADCRAGLALDAEHVQLRWLQSELRKPSSRRFQGSNGVPPVTK
jgi:hypothetical protein